MDELYSQVLQPLLFYIFQRISQVVYDPTLLSVYKQLWADEVWRFLANDTARQYLVSAGKTWRKGLFAARQAHMKGNATFCNLLDKRITTASIPKYFKASYLAV
jgi:hypothetical protein